MLYEKKKKLKSGANLVYGIKIWDIEGTQCLKWRLVTTLWLCITRSNILWLSIFIPSFMSELDNTPFFYGSLNILTLNWQCLSTCKSFQKCILRQTRILKNKNIFFRWPWQQYRNIVKTTTVQWKVPIPTLGKLPGKPSRKPGCYIFELVYIL